MQSKKCYIDKSIPDHLNTLYVTLILKLKKALKKKRHYVSDMKTVLYVADRNNETYFSTTEFLQLTKTLDDLFHCITRDCKYFTYTILKVAITASCCKKVKKLMNKYIEDVQNTLITDLRI